MIMNLLPACRIVCLAAALLAPLFLHVHMAAAGPASSAPRVKPLVYQTETLPNGLRVIYAPMDNAPVVHVRVLYHVGSRDERPDRQGFAHMFEHMMFRGSKHVADDQHGRLIGIVGGTSNAFTAFDQTTYIQTIPSNQLEMVLWLEADRMASFKVNREFFAAERNVVAEEWRLRIANNPYGPLINDFLRTAFTAHSYRWSPIGDMDQLRQSSVAELQEFWNTYYVPNNACLVIAGNIEIPAAKELVRKYFGWIPRGSDVPRDIPEEPAQGELRRLDVYRRSVPVPTMLIGFKTAPWDSPDHVALDVLANIVGDGRSSRLNRELVESAQPLAVQAGALNFKLQDHGIWGIQAAVIPGKNPKAVEEEALAVLKDVVENGVTQEELEKIRTQARIALIRSRETADSIATQLGEAWVFGGDPELVNRDVERLEALTTADLHAVAKKYLDVNRASILYYLPDPLGFKARKEEDKSAGMKTAAVVDDGRSVEPRPAPFPSDYPTQPPMADAAPVAKFNKGQEMEVGGLKVIVMTDDRLPLVNWSLVFRGGSDAEPAGKEGLGGLATDMARRGFGGMTFEQINQALESRGVTLEVFDGGDVTTVSGSATTDQLAFSFDMAGKMIQAPSFPPEEFAKLIEQARANLLQALAQPPEVAEREMSIAMFAPAPRGRVTTPASLDAITVDDCRAWIDSVFRRDGAFLVLSGDVTPERARSLAEQLAAALKPGKPPVADYTLPAIPAGRRIILVDNPDGKQANIRMAVRAYTLASDEKYAGSVVSRILSDGVESRLNRYVRAEKGLSYGVTGIFRPERHVGAFIGETDTNPETTGASIEAMFKVFNDLRNTPVSEEELSEGQSRITGGLALETQTIGQQARRRIDVALNGYPLNYFDVYPQKIEAVSAADVQARMKTYADPDNVTIVVVAPASEVKSQLEAFGAVQVVQMPLKRPGAQGKTPGLPGLLKDAPANPPATQPSR